MSSPPPVRRPDSVRPRGAPNVSAPASHEERETIERQLALLPTFSGATTEDVPELRALIVKLAGRGPGYNYAACLRWGDRDVPATLEQLRARFVAAGEWPAVVLADGLLEPVDLPARLAGANWVELERELVMVTRQQPSVPHLSGDLRLEAVTPRSAGECQTLEQSVFGLSDRHVAARTLWLAEAVDSGALRAFLVRLDGVPVASARLSSSDGVAAVSGVGVEANHRGRGLGTLVTSVATRAGLSMGNSIVWLSVDQRNAPAMRLYRRLGYVPSFSWSRWAASAR